MIVVWMKSGKNNQQFYPFIDTRFKSAITIAGMPKKTVYVFATMAGSFDEAAVLFLTK